MASGKKEAFALPSLNFKGEQDGGQMVVADDKTEYLGKYDPLVFCRTCANMDTCLVPIFKEEGLNYNLNKKIEKYLPIHVSQEDDLPVHLCYHCASTLVAWDTLIVGCLEAEKKLNVLKNSYRNEQSEKVIEVNENLPDETVDSDDEPLITKINKISNDEIKGDDQRNIVEDKNDYQPEQLDSSGGKLERSQTVMLDQENLSEGLDDDGGSEDGDQNQEEEKGNDCVGDLEFIPKSWLTIISCKHCGKISCTPKHLRQHEKGGSCTKTFQCDDCGQLFRKETSLMRHLQKHERDKLEGETKKFTCSVCKKKFKFEDNGLAHEKLCGRNESTHKCSVCGKRFETKEMADQHWTCHHKSCVCHMCGQSFGKPESLKQHVKTVHEDCKMVCHYCGKKFSRKARLQEHLQHHTGQMEFTCHVCGKGSTNAYSFGVHLATHSQETPYACSFCSRTFKHMKYVYLHERSVHLKLKSGKTYVKPKKPGKNVAQRTCSLCNKTFKRESAMLIHRRSVHEGKNGYVCKLCGKDFKYTYLLYVHKKKHHFPELCKYVCQFCEKPFPVKTELQNHLRKHTGEKPYACSICGKSYSFHGSLNMHIKTQHENKKNYKCEICGSSYNFQSHLARHMSAHADKCPVEIITENL